MARPREFDRDVALDRAMHVFWEHGFAATSTDALLGAMDIKRQSLYNAFGDKRTLYLEALQHYQAGSIAAHIERLDAPESPLAGIRSLLAGLAVDDDATRALGCMGVCSVSEFGDDPEVTRLRERAGRPLREHIVARLHEARAAGETRADLDPQQAADVVQLAMTGLQVAARDGATVATMHRQADVVVALLTA